MGCSHSHIYEEYPRINHWRHHFESLGLDEDELGALHKMFRRIDVDDSGKISLDE